MPQLLAPFTVLYVRRGDAWAPPLVTTQMDEPRARVDALRWATDTFGAGDYEIVGGESVRTMQACRWGERLA
jgi:hypothetical protein